MSQQPASKLSPHRQRCGDYTYQPSELELRGIVRECDKVLAEKTHPELTASVFSTKGLAYLRLGKFEDALVSFQNAVRHDPKDPFHRANVAAALVELGRVSEGIAECEAALRTFGKDAFNDIFWFNYAEALFLMDREADAHEAAAHGLALVDMKAPKAVFGAAKGASSVDADHEATLLFARYLALRMGKKLGEADPVTFIEEADASLKQPLGFPENSDLRRAILRVAPLVVGDDEDDSGPTAMLEQWADLRQAATQHRRIT